MDLFERILNTIFSIVIMMFFLGLIVYGIPLWIIGMKLTAYRPQLMRSVRFDN
jgi:hypothetical protein